MRLHIALSSLTVMFLTGCNNSVKNHHEVATIPIDVNNISDDASSFFDGWEFTALETTPENLISDVDKLDVSDSLIAICSNKIFHIFRRDGKWLSSFNHLGQGPGEYLFPTDVKIHDGAIYVMCSSSRKIHKYNTDGKHLATYDVKNPYVEFDFIDNNRILLASGDANFVSKHEYAIYDIPSSKIISESGYLKDPSAWVIDGFRPIVTNDGNKPLVTRLFDYTIYQYEDGDTTLMPFVKYEFNTPVSIHEYDGMTLDQKCENSRYKQVVRYLGQLQDFDKTLFQEFTFMGDRGLSSYIYKYDKNAKTGKLLEMGSDYYKDFPYLASRARLIKDGNYISVLAPFSVNYIENNTGARDISDKVKLNDDDNPVIVFHHFKKD